MTDTPVAEPPPIVAVDSPRPNLPEYTVSEISIALKRSIEENFSYVRVRGEISGWKRHSSGHCYLGLKDADAVIDAVCWRATAGRLGLRPEDGMEVICTGRVTTFPSRSKYQLVIERMELAGAGALLKLLEERKKRLEAEGLFAAERKKKLPFLPETIGVVTSPTGAVIRDILHRLADRFPRRVLLWPVAVQGDGAAAQVAAAIEGFNAIAPGGPVPRPDLLIVARGGGSLEDLMAFNEEIVVRAAAASTIPLISAVGHETDTTLIDFASDRRAPTPSAAAEMAVPVRLELLAEVASKEGRFRNALARLVAERRTRIEGLGRGLPEPRKLIETAAQRLDDRGERLVLAAAGRVAALRANVATLGARILDPRPLIAERRARLEACGNSVGLAFRHFLELERRSVDAVRQRLRPAILANEVERARERLANLAGRLESHELSHGRILERGYAMVRDRRGAVVAAAKAIEPGAALTLQFRDGEVDAIAAVRPRAAAKPTRRPQGDVPGQGKLL